MTLPVGTEVDLQREAFLRLPSGVVILRLDELSDPRSLRVVDCNEAAAGLTGKPREYFIGRRIYEYAPHTFDTDRPRAYADVVRTGRPCVVAGVDPRSSVVLEGSFRINAFPMADQCVGLLYLDATEREQAERRERMNARQLERAHEIARLGSWCYTLPDGPMTWSDEMSRICGREVGAGGLIEGVEFTWVHPDDRAMMRKDVDALRRDRRPRRRDIRVTRPDGTLRLLDASIELGVDETGRSIEIVGVVRDVTVERVALDAVARSERRLREAERVGQIGSWEWDIVAKKNVWSDELYRIYGLAPQAVDLSYTDVVSREHPDDRERLNAVIAQAMDDHRPFVVEHRIIRADGEVRWLRTRGKVVTDPQGAAVRLVGVAQDITEARLALAAQERLAAIVESSDDAIVGKALDGTIETWNKGAERLYGYTAAEMIGQPGDMLDVPGGVREMPALIAGIARGEQVDHLETVRRRKDGTLFPVALTMSPIHDATGAIIGVSTIARDITERRLAEDIARAAAERLRLASRATRDLIWDWDIVADELWWGDGTEQALGYRREEMPPTLQGWIDLLHPDDVERVARGVKQVLAEGAEFWSDEYRLRKGDGSYAHVHDRGYIVRDPDGKPLRMVGSCMDVTTVRQAEERVRRSERLLARAQELARLGSFHRDVKSETIWWSAETYRIYGVDPDTFTPTVESVLALVHPDDRGTWRTAATRARQDGAPFHIFFRIDRPDGEVRILASEGEVSFDADGNPSEIYGFVEDLTGRRRAEEELVRSRAQLRELAARIEATREEERTQISRRIHEELGQALTALKIDLTALTSRLPPRARALRKRARDMAETLDRTLHNTQTIAVELRPGILDVVGLPAAIRWAVDDFTRRTGIHCRATVTRAPIQLSDGATTAVFRILEEALTNIVRHAKATDVVVTLGAAEGLLTLVVGDNGVGITPGAVWGPRSLGLLGIRERARGVGGDVTMDGAPGRGTRLTLRLPLARDESVGPPL